jgi:two-component system, chemotaxis family, CheB/CheR fusion protein
MAKIMEPHGSKEGAEPRASARKAGGGKAGAKKLLAAIEELRAENAALKAKLEAEAQSAQALKENDAGQRLLVSELSHRVKNTLAVVQSMARQSFRGKTSSKEGLEAFTSRLRAFAEAHNLLVGNEWREADFRELARLQLEPYGRAGCGGMALEGPSVKMPPDVAMPFALVLHELATNALKYGALSSPEGTLRLEWEIIEGAPQKQFRFIWREEGGPRVEPSAREGFGSWLIQNGIPGAQVTLEFPGDGAICAITMPAPNFSAA